MTDSLLTRPEVEGRCGISKTTIYRLMRSGAFPEPIPVGARAVRWLESEIDQWISTRPKPRPHGKGGK